MSDAGESAFRIIDAGEEHVHVLLHFITELARYERLEHDVRATPELLKRALFGPRPAAEALIGYYGDVPVGFALFFQNFSTFLAKPGLYLEDLFVLPAWRGRGFGRQLLARLARIAVDRGYGRMEWAVLDWNDLAIGVYRSIGARPMSDWTVFRLTDDELRAFAEQSPP